MFLQQQLKAKYRFTNLIGDSDEMQQVFELIEKIASTDSTVFICGKSATGKELVARALRDTLGVLICTEVFSMGGHPPQILVKRLV